jgi:hypothetical protein
VVVAASRFRAAALPSQSFLVEPAEGAPKGGARPTKWPASDELEEE